MGEGRRGQESQDEFKARECPESKTPEGNRRREAENSQGRAVALDEET
jgi:hypothetical protein